jgi:hypothetical protein
MLSIFTVLTGGYAWDSPQRFAITAEEAGLIVVRAKGSLPVELARRPNPGQMMSNAAVSNAYEKIMKVIPQQDGSAVLEVNQEDPSVGFMDDQVSNLPIHILLVTRSWK